MAEVAEIWSRALPKILQGVTGRGVWTALNAAKPLLIDEGVLVLGVDHRDAELAGHLRIPATGRLMEMRVSEEVDSPVRVRVIDGTTPADWELAKRRDAERRRLQEAELTKMRAEMQAKSSWEGVYDQLGRRFAAVSNRSLPQNRARFFEEAIALVAEARREHADFDELGERNFARCIERLAQYAEVPSTLVAVRVLSQAGEL